jgi:acetyl esterase/lipase
MKRLITLVAVFALSVQAGAQSLISATDLGITGAALIAFAAGKSTYDVQAYKIQYNTTDVDGSPTIASGILCVPVNTSGCNSFPLGVYNHGTVLERENVPSRNNSEAFIAKALATQGLVTVSPDYLGLGDNPGLHPYLHAESQATATIDLMRAAREFLPDSLGLSLNGEVFVSGYSQGGHAAMATVKYIQDNNLFSEFNIVAAGPASGPYNLSGSQSDVLISNQPYSNPGYVCYLLFGLNRVYGNLFNNYNEILKAPYDTLIPPYFDGTYPMDSVNAKLPANLSGFMQDSVLANFVADSVAKNHPLWQALLAQDNYDWEPVFPVNMYYCTQDEQVSYQNSLDAEAAMNARGAVNVQAINKGAYTHGGCVTPSLFDARDWFTSLATACYIGVDEKKLSNLRVYPNPVQRSVHLDGLDPNGSLAVQIYSLDGALLKQYAGTPIKEWTIQDLPSGIYLLSIRQNQQEQIIKLVKE